MKILLASTSSIKKEAVEFIFPKAVIDTMDCTCLGLPEQPINNTKDCVLARLKFIRKNQGYDLYLAIENGIEGDKDVCFVAVDDGKIFTSYPCAMEFFDEYIASGCKTTYGRFLSLRDPSIQHNNWMLKYGYDRKDQIVNALDKMISLPIYWFEFHSQEQIVNEIFKLYNKAEVGEVVRVGNVGCQSLAKILSVIPNGKWIGSVLVFVKQGSEEDSER